MHVLSKNIVSSQHRSQIVLALKNCHCLVKFQPLFEIAGTTSRCHYKKNSNSGVLMMKYHIDLDVFVQ